MALWLALALMLGAFAGYEITRDRAYARRSAEDLLVARARLAAVQVAGSLDQADRTLATIAGFTARSYERVQSGVMRTDGVVYTSTASDTRSDASDLQRIARLLVDRIPLPIATATAADAVLSSDDDTTLLRFARVPGTDLVAFASMPLSQALAEHVWYAQRLALFTAAALLMITVPLALVARRALGEVHDRRELQHRYEQERRRARTDALTGVANRIAFNDHLERCNRALTENGTPFVLAIIDIDRFKALNDTRGHVAGDIALTRVARTLLATVRSTDLVARLGGDEFAVLMPAATSEGSPRICGKLHAALLAAAATADLGIGFSIGVVAFEEAPAESRVVTALADRLMYDVKSAGGEGVRYGIYRRDGFHLANEVDREEVTDVAT